MTLPTTTEAVDGVSLAEYRWTPDGDVRATVQVVQLV